MSLQIHRAERADRLAAELGEILMSPLPDPFATEVVAVPTQGVERWLAQTLSHRLGVSTGGRDGICAGVEFPSLRRLTTGAVAAASGIDARTDPWQPRRAVWPLLAVMDDAQGEAWGSLLWSYLGQRRGVEPASADEPSATFPDEPLDDPADGVRRGRRWSTAQHLAELFAGYGTSRPEMVLRWLAGHDDDASGAPLPPDYAWQAELWRRLRAEIGTPSPAERTAAACARLVADPSVSDLPDRVSVFGLTRLSPDHRAVLAALGEHRQIHLWLPHPSPAMWDAVSAAHISVDRTGDGPKIEQLSTAQRSGGWAGPRAGDRSVSLPANPLLAYLGRDVRELQLTLSGAAASDLHHQAVRQHGPGAGGRRAENAEDEQESAGQLSLLEQLQHDLTHDSPVRPPADRPVWDPADRSITVHASHGPDRQVEVLRELLVGLLADDPTLEPRDIVVMCPDIERFAPLISATFGLATEERESEHPGHRLRVRLADRALRQLNPLLAALSRVLGLADSRMEASALLDLCAFAPVAHKFSFSSDDLERLQDLVTRSGVRWGLDAEHRQAYAMGRFAQNTWAAGLDRLLLGVTMDEAGQQFIGTALPLDDVDSSDVDLVGRLAELLSRLRSLTVRFTSSRPLDEWIALCRETIELLTSVPAADSWQTAHAYAALGTLGQTAADEGGTELSLVELQALLAETFKGRASRANFRTGTLTMCTMMPMRSVPHRVICLLGVDDGVFPRRSSRDGDDILAAEPWIGDRDPRSEDRQLLLDAIMAAQEHLVVVYAGADARTRAERPPAVPIGAVLDAVDVTMTAADGRRLRDHIVTAHPLQPFDPKNFQPGQLSDHPQAAFSFDQESLHGARAALRPRAAVPSRYDTDHLPPVELPDVVALPDLVRFFAHPVKAMLRTRANLGSGWEEAETEDQIPVTLDGLQAWGIGTRMLEQHLEGTDLGRLSAAEWRRGSLPPQQFGERALRPVRAGVEQVAALSEDFLVGSRSSVDVLVPLTGDRPGGNTLAGTLTSVYGERLVRVNYSWLGPKHRLQAWIELLALTASHPDRSWQAVTIGRRRRSLLGPVPATWAGLVLSDLVDLYRTGLSEPLALAPKVAAEYARLRREDKSIANFADKLDQLWNEERDDAYESVFGARVKWGTLMERVSVPEEERGSLAEPSRLGSLARRVWHPLLASEVLG